MKLTELQPYTGAIPSMCLPVNANSGDNSYEAGDDFTF
jgi:hypothetical protein